MKKFIFCAAFILAPNVVHAQQILPNLYAKHYCEYRALGISAEDARTAAINDAYISAGTPTKVNYNGKMFSSDVIQAAAAVVKRCPQYLK